MTSSIVKLKDFDARRIDYGRVKKKDDNLSQIMIYYSKDDDSRKKYVFLQTPRMKIYDKIYEENGELYLNLTFWNKENQDAIKSQLKLFRDFDARNCEEIQRYNKDNDTDVKYEYMLTHNKQNDTYDIKLRINNKTDPTLFYDENKTEVTLNYIEKYCDGIGIIENNGLRIRNGIAFSPLKLLQMKIYKPEKITGYAFEDDSDDSDEMSD